MEKDNATQNTAPHPLTEKRWFLYLTEFISGVSVMAVELGASRLLAPYFSSSQIVWTIIIGMIMVAMALGNIYGGRIADKRPDPALLYRRILIASLWFAGVPFLGRYIIIGVSGLLVFSVSTYFLIIAAFVSCALLFVFPLFLLGTVTPSLVKFAMKDLGESGKVVGRLGACNTVGSIIGTFLPTFVTIPSIGTAYSFLLFAGLLLTLAVAYYLFSGRKVKYAWSCVAVVIYIVFLILSKNSSLAFWNENKIYEGESVYNYLLVNEDDSKISLSTNVMFGVQSVKMKEEGLTGMYYDYALAAPVMTGREKGHSVLVLGGGTGTYASQTLKYFDGCGIESVEIDEKITRLSHEYFSMPEDVVCIDYDGRAYLEVTDKKYDVILVDAYQDITIPFQMSTSEFFSLVAKRLDAGGVMAVNLNMRSGEGGITDYICDTIASVFPYVSTVDVTGSTNRVLFASFEGDPRSLLEKELYKQNSDELRGFLGHIVDRIEPYAGGKRILTDDRAPVELLGIKAIDGIISDELSYYRAIYEREGFKGLFRALGIE